MHGENLKIQKTMFVC